MILRVLQHKLHLSIYTYLHATPFVIILTKQSPKVKQNSYFQGRRMGSTINAFLEILYFIIRSVWYLKYAFGKIHLNILYNYQTNNIILVAHYTAVHGHCVITNVERNITFGPWIRQYYTYVVVK